MSFCLSSPLSGLKRLAILPLLAGWSVLLAGCGNTVPVNINTGQAAPSFSASGLEGATLNFPADLAGRPVVLRFWADWCRYCEGEMQHIEQQYRQHKKQGSTLEILAINAGQDRETAAAFSRKTGISYPVLLDEQTRLAKQYGVSGLPTTFFIDRQGIIRGKLLGEASAEVFARQLQTILP